MLARSKLISIESKISEALINNETSNEAFMVIINKEETIVNLKKASKWWIVKKVILKKIFWLRKAKKEALIEVIKRNEFINNSLKSKI